MLGHLAPWSERQGHIDLDDVDEGSRLDDLLDDRPAFEKLEGNSIEVTLDSYGYRWFRLISPDRLAPP